MKKLTKKQRLSYTEVANTLFNMADANGKIYTTRFQLIEKFDRAINPQHLKSWMDKGICKEIQWEPNQHNSPHYIELDLKKCMEYGNLTKCKRIERAQPKWSVGMIDRTKVVPSNLKKVSDMTFTDKVKALYKLFNTLFLK